MSPSPQKVALVTGAARGIGLAVAKRFLAEGWRVALLDIERELLHGAIAALPNSETTIALHCDVSDPGAVAAAMATVATQFGRLERSSTMPASRYSRRCWKRRTTTGTGCWPSISAARSFAPRRPHP